MVRAIVVLVALFLAAHSATGAEAIVGRAVVIDGDTLEIHTKRIRLYGIDAPESGQSCTVQGKSSRCGQLAALALADKIGSRRVTCEAKDRDDYNRVVAVCHSDGEDLNAWMVARGWAMAYRQYAIDYISQEQNASASRLGIWQGEFVPPWDWRRDRRIEADNRVQVTETKRPQTETKRPESCVIKGNVSARGEHIYHVPGGRYYDATQINPSKGERWFCSEAEAIAAGWRPSKR